MALFNLFPFDLESEDLPSSPNSCLGHQPKPNKEIKIKSKKELQRGDENSPPNVEVKQNLIFFSSLFSIFFFSFETEKQRK